MSIRRLVFAAIVACFAMSAAAAPYGALELSNKITGTLASAGTSEARCYNFTLPDNMVSTVVWWDQPKLLVRVDPCVGQPQLRMSVYGCPSDGSRTVYEFMSQTMVNDAAVRGTAVPKYWEWSGDVKTLTVDLTHRTYFVEVINYDSSNRHWRGTDKAPEFEIEARVFNAANETAEAQFPLKNLNKGVWDKKVSRKVENTSSTVFQGGESGPRKIDVEWYTPGSGENGTFAISDADFEYQVYALEVTEYIGNSDKGAFADITFPSGNEECPEPQLGCTSDDCRSCPKTYPKCAKEFLTDCSETTLNVNKLKASLSVYADTSYAQSENGRKVPFESIMKNPNEWTAWTVCGMKKTMNWIDSDGVYTERSATEKAQEGTWLKTSDLTKVGENRLSFSLTGLKEDNNNVYLVNVVTRQVSTGNKAAYEMMTLQMRTPRYEEPELSSTDMGIIIGVSCGLGACIIIFIIVAVIVRQRRKRKLQQRIRLKQ